MNPQCTESHDAPPALPPPPRPALILSLSLPMVKGGKIIPQPLWMESQLKDYAQQYAQQVSREATAQQAAEVQALRAEVAQLKLAEEGAKVAFGHVVQMKRDAEAARDKTHANLDAAHAIIRQQARAARQDGAGEQP